VIKISVRKFKLKNSNLEIKEKFSIKYSRMCDTTFDKQKNPIYCPIYVRRSFDVLRSNGTSMYLDRSQIM